MGNLSNKLSLCHKLKLSKPYIFATKWCKFIFWNIQGLRHCIEKIYTIYKSEFVAKTEIQAWNQKTEKSLRKALNQWMYFYKKGSTLGCFSNRALGETWEHILFSYLARQGGGGGRSGVYLLEKQGVWKQNSVGEDRNNKKEELKVREKIRNLKC